MSRKTKKEKIVAAKRREEKIIRESSETGGKISYNFTSGTFSLPGSAAESESVSGLRKSAVHMANPDEYGYVTGGLVRTLAFTVLAIASQIVLWYLMVQHRINLF